MTGAAPSQGYFSLLQWRPDIVRNEVRNAAVILLDPEGKFGGIQAAPIGTVSRSLAAQGIMDSLVAGIQSRFETRPLPDLAWLEQVRENMHRSILFTEPTPAAVFDPTETLESLYSAYVAPRSGASQETRFRILDTIAKALRSSHIQVDVGQRIGRFIFDAVAQKSGPQGPRQLIHVAPFGTVRKDATNVERGVGYFIYAVGRTPNSEGYIALQPPVEQAGDDVHKSWEEVQGMIAETKNITESSPSDLPKLLTAGGIQGAFSALA